jgi:hypothetical protein
MTPRVACLTFVLALLTRDGLVAIHSTASVEPAGFGVLPAIDVPAPNLPDTADGARSGGVATRIELDDADLSSELSAWYRLAYVDGGTHLRVFEHYAATTADAESDLVQSEYVAWQVANNAVGPANGFLASEVLPRWAWFRTGSDVGRSAGFMFTLAYVDLLTPGLLVGNLHVAGTGGIGRDGVVFPVTNVEIKVAAAMLTQPDVIFTTRPSKLIEHTTIVESEHTRNPDAGYTAGQWLNVIGYQQAGRDAAAHPGTVAFVVVHDIRQALAWLCGRSDNATTCEIARKAATIPIGSQ